LGGTLSGMAKGRTQPRDNTGALVYPNAPDPSAANGDGNAPPLSWATAPTVMTGSVGLSAGVKLDPATGLPDADQSAANTRRPTYVSRALLGVAPHPYGYQVKPGLRYFKNYRATQQFDPVTGLPYHHSYSTDTDIDAMNNLWQTVFRGMPIVYTEVNRTQGATAQNFSDEGAYLVDLMTYLYDRRCSWANGVCAQGITPSATPFRILWYQGVDSDTSSYIGLYFSDADKPSSLPSYEKPLARAADVPSSSPNALPAINSLPATPRCHNGKTRVTAAQTQQFAYFWLRNAACY